MVHTNILVYTSSFLVCPIQVKVHPEMLWVVKNSKHRGIKVFRAEGEVGGG